MIEEFKKIVTEEKDEIRRQYKTEIKAVFGSYSRGDFHADSDLDLLVDVDADATLLHLVGLQQFLEDRLGCKVDVVPSRSLREEIRDSVFKEMIDCENGLEALANFQLRCSPPTNDTRKRNYHLYLKDISEAMLAVQAFIEETDFDTFAADDKTASAVVRKLEIIGEATKGVPEEIRQRYPQVPWRQMAGMQDRPIHEDFDVNFSVVWQTATELIPPLQPIIAQILEDTE